MRLAYNRPPEGYTMTGKAKYGQIVGIYDGFTIWASGDVYMLTHEGQLRTIGPFYHAGEMWRWIADTKRFNPKLEVI